jgi:hypothetical protein
MEPPLLDERGRLREPGWAPHPRWRYDPRAVGRRLRRKEWDFYGVTTREHFLGLVIADVGYLGLAAAQWIDLAGRRHAVERASVTPLGWGAALPASSEDGDARYRFRSTHVEVVRNPDGSRRVHGAWPELTVELELAPAQGVAVAAPLGGGRGFYYNHKVPAIPARGAITLAGRRVELDDAFATLDWGRGVWPYHTSWRWAVAQGRLADGRAIGLTLGDVSADAGAAREDAAIVGGALHKLAPVEIEFDREHPLRPWRVRGPGVDLTLEPRVDNGRRVQLGIASSQLASAIGFFYGTITAGAETIALRGVPGWAEEHRARW